MKKLKVAARFIDTTSEKAGKVASFALLAMLAIGFGEVLLRYVFSKPTSWAWEVNGQLLCFIVSLGAAYSLQQGFFINVDIFYRRFPLRLKAYADIFTLILTLIFCGVLLWQGAVLWMRSLSILEVSNSAFASPLYPIKFFVPVAAFLVILQAIVKFTRQRAALKNAGKDD